MDIDKFIEDHIVMDEIDGIERTLVEFNFNDWIRFKRESLGEEKTDILEKYIEEPKVFQKPEHIKQKSVLRKKTKYPKEMKEFIESRMKITPNQDLCDLINEKWNLDINVERLKSYMKYNKLKRKTRFRGSKIWTNEVIKFLKDNIDNFSNKEFCVELDKRFGIKTKSANLMTILSIHEIKRFHKEMDSKIVNFIKKSKNSNLLELRDDIIEQFEVNIPTAEIKKFFIEKKKLPGEEVSDEVERVKSLRDSETFEDDEDIDGMELD